MTWGYQLLWGLIRAVSSALTSICCIPPVEREEEMLEGVEDSRASAWEDCFPHCALFTDLSLTPLYFCLEYNDKWPPSKKGAMPVGYKNIKRSKRAPYKPAQFCTDGCYKLPVSLLTVKGGVDGREHEPSLGRITDSYIFSGQRNPELPAWSRERSVLQIWPISASTSAVMTFSLHLQETQHGTW